MSKEYPINDSWPYIEVKRGTESDSHLRMKNLVIDWLRGLGFSTKDIEVEKRVESSQSHGYTDVYASRSGFEIFVECERNAPLQNNLSAGGSIPARAGKLVYYLTESSMYRVRQVTMTAEKVHRPAVANEPSEKDPTHEFKRIQFDLLGPAPSRDVEKFEYSPEAQRREREKVDWL